MEKGDRMNSWLEWGIPIIEWFQNLGDAWLPPMEFFSFLGTEYFIMFVMPAFFWCYDASTGFRLGFVLLTSNGINGILKISFGTPRPFWVSSKVKALAAETSFGVPSGHAQNAVVLWGRLATLVQSKAITIVCLFLILMISASRLYLAVHFPTDVLVGWLVGGVLLVLFIFADAPIGRWLKGLSLRNKIIAAFILPLCILIIGLPVISAADARGIPEAWVETANAALPGDELIDPTNPEATIAAAGSLLGFSIGYVFLYQWGEFNAKGSWLKRVGRFLLGIVGVVVIYFGLRAIFPDDINTVGLIFRFVRYAILSFWVSYLAPRTFVALKLA
jgi:membrane-associated phospholipid phosphatase